MNLVKYIAVSLTAFNLFACTDSFFGRENGFYNYSGLF